jgi:ribosomal protein S18 acetylase RimI-like enzyme
MSIDVRELRPDDLGELRAFFAEVPPEDRTFFKDDVTDPSVAEWWVHDKRCLRRLALDEDRHIVAFAALLPKAGRSSHVAEVLVVVAGRARRQGVGRQLARRMLVEAVEHDFTKVMIELAAENTGPIVMFRGLGFEPEALLRDQLRGEDGTFHDIVVLSHLVDEKWSTMLTGGLDQAVR